jgi:hypothetical protein
VYTGPISLDEGKFVVRFWSIDDGGNVDEDRHDRDDNRDHGPQSAGD